MSDQNPYMAGESETEFAASGAINLHPGQPRGMVGQVPILGVLMIIQGAFVVILGIGVALLAMVMPAMIMQQMQNNPGLQGNGPAPVTMTRFMLAIYGGISIALLLIGISGILAGLRVFQFQRRVFGIISLSVGLGTIVGCYCFPTALALMIYGLIVLVNQPVITAFELGRQGHSSQEIQQAFARLEGN